jgi:hypothetical protein
MTGSGYAKAISTREIASSSGRHYSSTGDEETSVITLIGKCVAPTGAARNQVTFDSSVFCAKVSLVKETVRFADVQASRIVTCTISLRKS